MNSIKLSETQLTKTIRDVLDILKIPHFKHFGGPLSPKGVPDLIGVLPPSGRMLLIEVKKPGGKTSPEQSAFLRKFGLSGAFCLVAFSAQDVIVGLVAEGYEPAKKIHLQFGKD